MIESPALSPMTAGLCRKVVITIDGSTNVIP